MNAERPAKIIVAPDSFKGSLTAADAADAMAAGIHSAVPNAHVIKVPITDGGEGTVDTFLHAAGGEKVIVTVTGPLMEPVSASYGVLPDGTAVVEAAAASGLTLVLDSMRDPLRATSKGTGQLIAAALLRGCRKIIIGMGGTATNDGGIGLLDALGIAFYDHDGKRLHGCGESLEKIEHIDCCGLLPQAREAQFFAACDVKNKLCGENGAAYVFGPQKGASPQEVKRLDRGLAHFAQKALEVTGKDMAAIVGGGAAGGMSAGVSVFLNAELSPGFDLAAKATHLEQKIDGAAVLFTGEGKTDEQTVFGKVPAACAALAQKHNVPVVCLSGAYTAQKALYPLGITALFSITSGPMTLPYSIENAPELLRSCAENATRLFFAGFEKS